MSGSETKTSSLIRQCLPFLMWISILLPGCATGVAPAYSSGDSDKKAAQWFRERLYSDWDSDGWNLVPEDERTELSRKWRRLPSETVNEVLREVLEDHERSADVDACVEMILARRCFDVAPLLKRRIRTKFDPRDSDEIYDSRLVRWLAHFSGFNRGLSAFVKETSLKALSPESLRTLVKVNRDHDESGDVNNLIFALWVVGADDEMKSLQEIAQRIWDDFNRRVEADWGKALSDKESLDVAQEADYAKAQESVGDNAKYFIERIPFRNRIDAMKSRARLAWLAESHISLAEEPDMNDWIRIQLILYSTPESGTRALRDALGKYVHPTDRPANSILEARLDAYEWIDSYGDGLTDSERVDRDRLLDERRQAVPGQ